MMIGAVSASHTQAVQKSPACLSTINVNKRGVFFYLLEQHILHLLSVCILLVHFPSVILLLSDVGIKGLLLFTVGVRGLLLPVTSILGFLLLPDPRKIKDKDFVRHLTIIC